MLSAIVAKEVLCIPLISAACSALDFFTGRDPNNEPHPSDQVGERRKLFTQQATFGNDTGD